MIAVADTYDVITARDSYRKPIRAEDAVAELRRVAGHQLDPHVVEVFIELLTAGDLSFPHGDDADFEAELAFGGASTRTPSPERGNRPHAPQRTRLAPDR